MNDRAKGMTTEHGMCCKCMGERDWLCSSCHYCTDCCEHGVTLQLVHDGAGQLVSSESAAKAVAAFSELWGNALFDCGPQDYEFMQQEILDRFREPAGEIAAAMQRVTQTLLKLTRAVRDACADKAKCKRCGDTREVEGGTMPGAIRCPDCPTSEPETDAEIERELAEELGVGKMFKEWHEFPIMCEGELIVLAALVKERRERERQNIVLKQCDAAFGRINLGLLTKDVAEDSYRAQLACQGKTLEEVVESLTKGGNQ